MFLAVGACINFDSHVKSKWQNSHLCGVSKWRNFCEMEEPISLGQTKLVCQIPNMGGEE